MRWREEWEDGEERDGEEGRRRKGDGQREGDGRRERERRREGRKEYQCTELAEILLTCLTEPTQFL